MMVLTACTAGKTQATEDSKSSSTSENGSDNGITASATGETSNLSENVAEAKVTYIGNAGFMITTSHKKIIIDGLFKGWIYEYTLPEDIQNSLALAEPPFDNIDLILVSHGHQDHYSHDIVEQHLENDPNAVFASQSNFASDSTALVNQIIILDPAPGEPDQVDIDGINVKALALSHGKNQPSNIGFVVTVDGIKLFFPGDIDISDISYEEFRAYNLPEEEITIAFIPHIILTNGAAEQRFVKEGIGAKYIIPYHYYFVSPPMNRKTILAYYPDAIFFNKENSSWVMPE